MINNILKQYFGYWRYLTIWPFSCNLTLRTPLKGQGFESWCVQGGKWWELAEQEVLMETLAEHRDSPCAQQHSSQTSWLIFSITFSNNSVSLWRAGTDLHPQCGTFPHRSNTGHVEEWMDGGLHTTSHHHGQTKPPIIPTPNSLILSTYHRAREILDQAPDSHNEVHSDHGNPVAKLPVQAPHSSYTS